MTQNYCRARLRGKSFKGQDLTGADFSYCDIRGADFTDAILRRANFSHAKAGLQRRWAFALVIFALLLSAVSGLLSGVSGSLVGFILVNGNRENIYVGTISLIVLLVFFLITLCRGVTAASGFLAVAVTWAGVAAVAWAGIVAVAWVRTATETGIMELAALVAVIVTGAVSVVVAATGVVVIAGAAVVAGAVAGLLAVAVTVAAAGAVAGAVVVAAAKIGGVVAGTLAVTVTVSTIVLSANVACLALLEDEKQSWVRNVALGLVTRRGTSFQGCDLTDTDFTQARLKNSNFIKSILTRTCWFQVQKLNLADVRTTYLEDENIRQLLVTKDLQNKNFDGWNLQGINLQGANIKDASLIAAKLNESNLQDADLSRTNLTRAQLDRTDFRGATLTGAYIGDWGITQETKLDGVKCEYIFMYVPTKDNPNPYRLPTNWEESFKDGEFSQFISPSSKLSQI
ncbi:pentapeptide repeat-containing protein [Mastigocladopsis repens]|uniref:pentapeptide repeat-containing protein n=1 Tax=Mastigocladopsis repens TaxID=221287 RepID=UPI00030DF0C5|nr:pentapeptide repeat-containing protein [Mastigocladopsis repens]